MVKSLLVDHSRKVSSFALRIECVVDFQRSNRNGDSLITVNCADREIWSQGTVRILLGLSSTANT